MIFLEAVCHFESNDNHQGEKWFLEGNRLEESLEIVLDGIRKIESEGYKITDFYMVTT